MIRFICIMLPPVLSLLLYYKQKGAMPRWPRMALEYALFALTVNLPAFAILYFFNNRSAIEISNLTLDFNARFASKYSLIAILFALMLPFLWTHIRRWRALRSGEESPFAEAPPAEAAITDTAE